jgi:hypothetical protein
LINEVVIEGIVVRDPWKFMEDLFFRLVVYRDSDLPSKKLDLERDAGDYINIRVTGGANGLIHIRRGMRLRVHGFFQSRDFQESLDEYINKVRKTKTFSDLVVKIEGVDLKSNQVLLERNIVEVVARRIIVLDAAIQNEKKAKPADKNATIRTPVAIENRISEKTPEIGEQNLNGD